MRTSCKYIIPALILLFPACQREVFVPIDENQTVSITVMMETETKATVGGATGAFAFSNGDAIKVFDGSSVYTATTESTSSSAVFEMPAGFNGYGPGFVGFPASSVAGITASGVTFFLPAVYEYDEIGGSDANAAKVPCPMLGSYDGGPVILKAACCLVRFCITNVAAGTLSFTFPVKITGSLTSAITPMDGDDDGILASNLNVAGNTVSVLDVPSVEAGNYIWITLPLPTGTPLENILVTNVPDDASHTRMDAVSARFYSPGRAEGYKMFVSLEEVPIPTYTFVGLNKTIVLAPGNLRAHIDSYTSYHATADRWRFGGCFETLKLDKNTGGNMHLYETGGTPSSSVGKWVDTFTFQGTEGSPKVQGLVHRNFRDTDSYFGSGNLYTGCWSTQSNNGAATEDYIHIENGGTYDWRPMSSLEFRGLIGVSSGDYARSGAIVNGTSNARSATATVVGERGILIFPDSESEIWDTSTMGTIQGFNSQTSASFNNNIFTASNMVAMAKAGISFIPEESYYWTSTGSGSGTASAFQFSFDAPVNGRYYSYVTTWSYRPGAVRLIRVVE